LRTRIQVLGVCWLICLSPRGDAGAEPPLLESVKNPDQEALRPLVAQAADVKVLPDAATALHWTARCDDPATANLLRRAGARVCVANGDGVTPLGLACESGKAAMVAVGLGRSNDDSRSAGTTVLEATTFLTAPGADINAANNAGDTALHGAACRGNDHLGVRYMVDQGAAFNPNNKNGWTPLDVAGGLFPGHVPNPPEHRGSPSQNWAEPAAPGTPGSRYAGEVMGM